MDNQAIRKQLQELSLEDVEAVKSYIEYLNSQHKKKTVKKVNWGRVLFMLNCLGLVAFLLSNLLLKINYFGL